jgi:hypothetical protein
MEKKEEKEVHENTYFNVKLLNISSSKKTQKT